MQGISKMWGLVALVLMLGGCGPTARECGQSILLMAPVITIIGAGIAALFNLLWTPMIPSISVSLRSIRNAAIVFMLPCIPVLLSEHLVDDWLFTAFWTVGASYLTFLLLCIRIATIPPKQKFYRHIFYVPWLVLYPGAAYFAFFGSTVTEPGDLHLQLWILPGYFGIVAGPLLLLALFEVLVRRHLHYQRKAAETLPRPLPVATAKIR